MRNILDFVAVALCLMFTTNTSAQYDSLLYESSSRIDTTAHGVIRLNIDGMGFFLDNEYKGNLVKGYTLPGFWLQPTISYQPLKKLKLEAGIYMLHYWGANKYPNMNYKDIATWKGQQTQEGFHIIHFFRETMTPASTEDNNFCNNSAIRSPQNKTPKSNQPTPKQDCRYFCAINSWILTHG